MPYQATNLPPKRFYQSHICDFKPDMRGCEPDEVELAFFNAPTFDQAMVALNNALRLAAFRYRMVCVICERVKD